MQIYANVFGYGMLTSPPPTFRPEHTFANNPRINTGIKNVMLSLILYYLVMDNHQEEIESERSPDDNVVVDRPVESVERDLRRNHHDQCRKNCEGKEGEIVQVESRIIRCQPQHEVRYKEQRQRGEHWMQNWAEEEMKVEERVVLTGLVQLRKPEIGTSAYDGRSHIYTRNFCKS